MSSNFSIIAERVVFVPSVNVYEVDRKYPVVWQTPTIVTEAILNDSNPFEAYCSFVYSRSTPKMLPKFYSFEDEIEWFISCSKEVKFHLEPRDSGYEHIEELLSTMKELEAKGYTFSYGGS